MNKVYYVRHGQSETNVKGVFAGGQDDTPLTDIGRNQASQAGKELAHRNIQYIVASPLSRTRETAEIIAKEIGFDTMKIELDDNLREFDIGSGNGMPIAGMTAKKMMAIPDAEDPKEFAARIRQGLKNAAAHSGTVLIVGHAGVGRAIEAMRSGRNVGEFYDLPGYPNGHAVLLDLDWLE